jgi:surface antigen
MRDSAMAVSTLVLGVVLTCSTAFAAKPAHAVPQHRSSAATHAAVHTHHAATAHTRLAHAKSSRTRHVARSGGISCVPFARSDSGIEVAGNAWQWWDNAAGLYARGHVPEAGSVLAFRANPRMRLGHVAVVTRVINPREVEIDHANWAGGGVKRGMAVVDVSEANDWTAVRVEIGDAGQFGSVYPTYGFIYDRSDTGTMVAANHAPAPQPVLDPPVRDLRPVAERPWRTYEEVAEAPSSPRRPVEITPVRAGVVGSIDRK